MTLIGIGGTDGSGKDTIGEMLADNFAWLYVSISDILRDELKRHGAALSRENLRKLSARWRREQGAAVLIDRAAQEFESLKKKPQGLVIASLRHPAEAQRVHELGGKVVWTDADPRVRYKRLMARERGSEDKVSFAEFVAEEKTQMQHHRGDEATLNLDGVKAKADIIIENNGNDVEAFKTEVAKKLGL